MRAVRRAQKVATGAVTPAATVETPTQLEFDVLDDPARLLAAVDYLEGIRNA